ncbi:MAG: hypothetical protein WD398_05220 [Cyclobacteriaceae bacterium]
MALGIKSRTLVKLTTHHVSSGYAIGMQSLPSGPSLPFSWSIDPISKDKDNETTLFFSWDEAFEPKPFLLKALVSKSEDEWQMLPV